MARGNGKGKAWSFSTYSVDASGARVPRTTVVAEERRPFDSERGASKVRLRWSNPKFEPDNDEPRYKVRNTHLVVRHQTGPRRGLLIPKRRRAAEIKAEQLHARLFATEGVDGLTRDNLTLNSLFRLYEAHHLSENGGEKYRTYMRRVMKAWRRFLGEDLHPEHIRKEQWLAYRRKRQSGAIDANGKPVPEGERKEMRPRTVNDDLEALRTILRWGTEWDGADHRKLLRENPVHGYPLVEEDDRHRPVITQGQYEALLDASADVIMYRRQAGGRGETRSYLREMLVVANGTGRRIGAIRHLRITDWDADRGPYGSLRFRQEFDKESLPTCWVPVDEDVREAVQDHLARIGALPRAEDDVQGAMLHLGEPEERWLWPHPGDPEKPVSASLALRWFKRAEEDAKLWEDEERPDRFGWHGFRAKFASEYLEAGHPLAYVCRLGGWRKGSQVPAEIYERLSVDKLHSIVGKRGTLRRVS